MNLRNQLADDLDREDEADVSRTASQTYERAVVTGSDWTTETLLNQLRRKNIDLNPRFQRRDAWTTARKSRFIESLFLGLPVPQLVLAERPGGAGTFLVLDGKQRLLSLMHFAGIASQPSGDPMPALSLTGLDVLPDLNGLSLSDFDDNPERRDDLNRFHNRTIRTAVVRSWPNEDFLYLVFLRLNSETVPLSPQELRQALHPGPFGDFLDDFSVTSGALQTALHLDGPDFRMRDVETLLRFYAFDYFLEKYRGNLKAFLDMTLKTLNKNWGRQGAAIRRRADTCVAAIDTTMSIFGPDHAFATYTKSGYERRFNRAVFDIMTYYFKSPGIAERARKRRQAVKEMFKHLCSTDTDFLQSLQSTTKSVDATRTRLVRWGEALKSVIRYRVDLPSIGG
jgi:hypothetical protein